MEFLKEILGEELFKQVTEKVNAYNEDEANKDKQIKIANLGSGEYVSKLKYDGILQQLEGKGTELSTANELIEQLKKGTKGDEELQGKITGYETQVANLQSQLEETKIKSAIKVALLSEKAVDVDYLTFKLNEKLKEKGEKIELDESDNIKGWDSLKEGLKVQFPTMFEAGDGSRKVIENKLEKPDSKDSGATVTKEQFEKMGYKSRVELKENNPELYKTLTE